jgi:hypothetical protein
VCFLLLLQQLVVRGEQCQADEFDTVVVAVAVVAVDVLVGGGSWDFDEASNVLDFERLRVFSHKPHQESPHEAVPRFSLYTKQGETGKKGELLSGRNKLTGLLKWSVSRRG